MKFVSILKSALRVFAYSSLVTAFSMASVFADDNYVESIDPDDAPVYSAPAGSSVAVFTTEGGKVIAQFRGTGDDVAFGRNANGEASSTDDNDDITQGFDLGFEINFFGKPYSQIFPTTNGWVSLSGPNDAYGLPLDQQLRSLCGDIDCDEDNPATGIAALSGDIEIEPNLAFPELGVYWGQALIDGKPSFVVTYYGAPIYGEAPQAGGANGAFFQLVLQSMGDNGDFNAIFNYDFIHPQYVDLNSPPNVVAGYGIATDPDDEDLTETTSIFITPLPLEDAVSTAQNIADGTALQVITNNSVVPGRYILFMRSGQSFNSEEELIDAGFNPGAGGGGNFEQEPAATVAQPTVGFIFANDPNDKNSRTSISRQGDNLICSAGTYRFGLNENATEVAMRDVAFKLYLDGKLIDAVTKDGSSHSWNLAALSGAKGLATCSISMTYAGVDLSDRSDSNSSRTMGSASSGKDAAKSTALRSSSIKLVNALAALEKAKADIRQSFSSQRQALKDAYSKTVDTLKSQLASSAISSKAYTSAIKSENALFEEKLNALMASYKKDLSANAESKGSAKSTIESELLALLNSADTSYAKTIEEAGYAVVIN